jgi:hypothetical protein
MWIEAEYFAEVLDDLSSRVEAVWDFGGHPDEAPAIRPKELTVNCGNLLMLLLSEHGIPQGRASQRVARIETVFWEGQIRETDEHTNRARSSAILKRFRRFHPHH